MDHEILIDPSTDRVYYLLDSYSGNMIQTTEERIWELQNELNSKLESDSYLSLNDYMKIIMEDWPEEIKLRYRERCCDPDYKGLMHKIGNIEYAFLQVRTNLEDDNKTIIMLEPFPIPDMET